MIQIISRRFPALYLFVLLVATGCKTSDKPMFTTMPASATGIDFTNKLLEKPLFSILYYLYYYNGGGVATGDINNDGLTDIYFTANNKAGNKLYLNKGGFKFEDITAKANVAGSSDWCTGVTMADVNGDGWLDIYVSAVANRYGLKGRNELFINNGNGTFKEQAREHGLDVSCFTTQTAFFDYDHDGDLDCFILNQSHNPHANVVDTSNRRKYDSLAGDRLYRNDLNLPAKKFTDVSASVGIYQSNLGYGLGIAVADFNNDGWEDIYVGNDFHENDYYYVNNQNGTFSEQGSKHFKHYSRFSMGNDAADYNNDGQLDLITVDMLPPDEKILKTYGSDENPNTYRVKLDINGYQAQFSKNCLQQNNGSGSSFSETALQSGVSATDWSWAPLFADFDNDGKKDLFISSGLVKRPVDLDYIKFVSDLKAKGMDKTDKYDQEAINGMPDGASHPFFFKGSGDNSFADVSKAWGTSNMSGYYNGSSYADLDNDGNLDMVINCIGAPAVVLKNEAPPKKYLSISFKGDGMNTGGIGAKAYLFCKGQLQYQQLMLTRGFQSSCEPRLHFGLDTINLIDSLLIVWPNQQYQLLTNVPTNKPFIANQKNATQPFIYTAFFPAKDSLFTNISDKVACNWKHKENDFVDFNQQYLIPHKQSTRGPKLAVGDVNKDGLDDFYACGASGQPGSLMIQQQDGKFVAIDSTVFAADAICEDVDAAFFDADGDGFVDLWVVSGGNEITQNNNQMADRLYLNDKHGHFAKTSSAFTPNYANKSCIATADFDKDGDIDVFIGNLCQSATYGLPVNSFLYINDGKGNFSLDDEDRIKLASIGMVTTASFADFDKDGWPDLAVAGEWMPMKIFKNEKGKFVEKDVSSSTGLWQNIFIKDVNGDGYDDILAGNWGHNTKLFSGKNGPLKLYVKDFDKNGSTEQIMAYTIDGNEYTFLAKDELERALPVLNKAYLYYHEVAGKTVQFMFYDLFKDYAELKAEVLGSSVFTNDGKGGFARADLPEALQMAPIMTFGSIPNTQTIIGAGNFYGVIPYEGRYDALLPTVFSLGAKPMPLQTIPAIDGEVRDIKWLKGKNGNNTLAIVRNNNSIVFLKQK